MSKKELSPIAMLLDENNTDNIVLYDDKNKEVEFEQIAIIPLDEKVYAILRPVGGEDELPEDEALVFVIDELDDEDVLMLEEDDNVIDKVFDKYYELLKQNGVEVEIEDSSDNE